MIFPGFPGVLSFSQVFQVEWEPWIFLLTQENIADFVERKARMMSIFYLDVRNSEVKSTKVLSFYS